MVVHGTGVVEVHAQVEAYFNIVKHRPSVVVARKCLLDLLHQSLLTVAADTLVALHRHRLLILRDLFILFPDHIDRVLASDENGIALRINDRDIVGGVVAQPGRDVFGDAGCRLGVEIVRQSQNDIGIRILGIRDQRAVVIGDRQRHLRVLHTRDRLQLCGKFVLQIDLIALLLVRLGRGKAAVDDIGNVVTLRRDAVGTERNARRRFVLFVDRIGHAVLADLILNALTRKHILNLLRLIRVLRRHDIDHVRARHGKDQDPCRNQNDGNRTYDQHALTDGKSRPKAADTACYSQSCLLNSLGHCFLLLLT